jgi:hypothetical protein
MLLTDKIMEEKNNSYWIVLIITSPLRYAMVLVKGICILPVLIDDWIDKKFEQLE